MADTTARSSFSTKLLVIVFAVLLLIAGGLIVGDRMARSQATKQVATSMQEKLGTKDLPEVTMGGTPFLTQVLSNNYKSITLKAKDVTTTPIPLALLEANLTDVQADRQMTKAIARQANGRLVVGWQALSDSMNGMPIAFQDPDRIKVTYNTTIFGLPVQAEVTAKPTVDVATSTVVLNDPTMNIASVALPQDMVKPLIATLVKPIPVPLPAALKATGGTATADGMAIDFSGENVDMTKLQ